MTRLSKRHPSEQRYPTSPNIWAPEQSLCPESELRERMSDPEFWEHVLLGPNAAGPDYDIDLDDIEQMQGSPCTSCGAVGACAYDAEGRPMIHTTEDDET